MRKKNKKMPFALLYILIVTCGIAGVWLGQEEVSETESQALPKTESRIQEVTVDINTEKKEPVETEEIIDEQTGEKVIAQVQVNEPIKKKEAVPPPKPKAEGSYTNPEKPPTYSKEQTVVKEKPKNNTTSSPNKSQSSGSGKVYIDGFGYVEKSGNTKVKTGVSDGDINKMVGTMD